MVLGAALANDLFVQESPVGQTIFIGEWPFLVVGVLEWVGDPVAVAPAGLDSGVFVPFRACAAAFRGNEQAAIVRLRLTSLDAGTAAVTETLAALEPRRRLRGETSGEYQVINTIDRVKELTLVLTGLKIAVGLVGIAVAWALTKVALLFSQVPAGARPHISMLTALMALSLLTLVGLVSGVWPAKRAAAVSRPKRCAPSSRRSIR